MLTWLDRFLASLRAAQPVPLPDVPHARRGGDGPVPGVLLRSGDHFGAAAQAGQGPADPADGPASHLLTKKGTPTMGGLMILFGLFVSALLWGNLDSPYVWIVLFVTVGFGAIGFYDDYLKVTKQSHRRLFRPRAARAANSSIAAIACFAMMLRRRARRRPRSRCRSSTATCSISAGASCCSAPS